MEVAVNVSGEKSLGDMTPEEVTGVVQDKFEWLVDFLPVFLSAAAVFVLGYIFINCLMDCIQRRLAALRLPSARDIQGIQEELAKEMKDMGSEEESEESVDTEEAEKERHIDPTVLGFTVSAVNFLLKGSLAFIVMSMLGIHTRSIVAVLAAGSLALGLALQNVLTDLAKGIVLIILQPFHVGDFVKLDSITGKIKKVDLFNTYVLSPDNLLHIIPNRKIATISNVTVQGSCRIDTHFLVSNDEEWSKVKTLLIRAAYQQEMCKSSPPPTALLKEINKDGYVAFIRAWVHAHDLLNWDFVVKESVKMVFDQEKVRVPRNVWIDPPAGSNPPEQLAIGAKAFRSS